MISIRLIIYHTMKYTNELPKSIQAEIQHNTNIQKYLQFIEEQENNTINDILWDIYHGYCNYEYNCGNKDYTLYHQSFEEIRQDKTPVLKICKKYLMLLNIDMIEYIMQEYFNN